MRLNPVISRELRIRLRGSRAHWGLLFFVAILSLFTIGGYLVALRTLDISAPNGSGAINGQASAGIGLGLFSTIAFVELTLICFMAPAFTASAISGERERQTYDILVTTLVRPSSIIIGKLISSMSYILLLIVTSVPVTSIVFLFGGVSPGSLAVAFLILFVTALTFGAIGLFFSSWLRWTITSIVMTYGTVLILVLGSFIAFYVSAILNGSGAFRPVEAFLYVNPFAAMFSLISPQLFQLGSSGGSQGAPIWEYTVGIYLGVTILLLFLSSRFIMPVNRWRLFPATPGTPSGKLLTSEPVVAQGIPLVPPGPAQPVPAPHPPTDMAGSATAPQSSGPVMESPLRPHLSNQADDAPEQNQVADGPVEPIRNTGIAFIDPGPEQNQAADDPLERPEPSSQPLQSPILSSSNQPIPGGERAANPALESLVPPALPTSISEPPSGQPAAPNTGDATEASSLARQPAAPLSKTPAKPQPESPYRAPVRAPLRPLEPRSVEPLTPTRLRRLTPSAPPQAGSSTPPASETQSGKDKEGQG